MASAVYIVVILILLLLLALLWMFWPAIKLWVNKQREPFNEFIQKLRDDVKRLEAIDNEHMATATMDLSSTFTNSMGMSTSYTTGSTHEENIPIINYRSEEFTSEPVETKELITQFRTHPENRHKYFYEEQCRQIFEELFPGYKFSKCRPSWLINPRTKRPLELDGYNEELQLAFEYNGPQHYHFPNQYHRTEGEWIEQKYRDLVKHQACNQQGVYLITIPYHVPRHHLRSFITRYVSYYRRMRSV